MNVDALMQEAIDCAMRGRGEVEPNPRVGCLLLQDGEVIARGWHEYFGGRHAEAMALEIARANGKKPDTAVVTLEPCSTPKGEQGKKTPPCAQALIDAGIQRVVIGSIDPDPRHRRQGIVLLENAGIEIAQDTLSDAQSAIQPLFPYLDTLRWAFIALALAGIGLTVWARLDDWNRGRR